MSFVGLHIHTDYSLLDGASQIPKLIDKAIELGMPAIALTDHGVMYGAIELIKACRGKGIKPIIGNEMYVINEPLDTKARCRRYHQVVLAKNTQGYKNLVKLTTISSLEGIHGKGIFARPCINKELLEQYHDDLIVTSACLGGEIPQAILQNKLDVARKVAKWYKKLFGDDYYLELQDHGSQEDRIVNVELVKIARELNIKLIATNDSHFISCYDVEAHDALLCIQTGKLITEDKRMRYSGTEYMKSAEEMALLFRDHLSDEVIQEAIANTLEVASKIEPYHILGEPRIPDFQCPPGETPNTYVEWIAKEGLKDRFKVKTYEEIPQVYRDRLVYEVEMLQKMGFAAYFLVVWDYIKYARDRGIPVGPGRGSAAGSLVAYAMQITNIDPVHHGLLFERFLNPERKSMPDIDTDFCISRRDEVIQYVTEKYGKERVAQIITFNRMTSKAVLKDVARVLGVPYKKSDEMAKLIPVARGKPEKLAVMISDKSPAPEFREAYVKNEEIPRDDGTVVQFRQWLDMAIRIEGTNKSSGVHAAGVVISADRLDEIVPLQKNNDGATITQYPMEDLESLGLLKMDFLGLKNLTMIQKTLDYIKETKHFDFDPYQFPAEERRAQEVRGRGTKKFPEDIEKTYKILAKGDLEGVFQLESSGMKQIVQELKPSSLEDISSILALYRPGPLDAGLIPKFIDRKHGREAIQYEHPLLEPILNETYGILCLPQGTQINKPDGSTVAIEDIQPGDWVLTSNGRQVWEAKVAKQWRSGSKEILKITLSSGTVIYTSKSHRFLTPEGDKEAWELKAGPGGLKNAHIYSSVLYEQWPISSNSQQLNPNEAYLLGLFIGDGNLVSSTPNIACSREETAKYVANLIGSTWGGEPKYYFHTGCWYAYSKFKTQPKPTPLTQFMDGLYGGRSWKVKSQQKHLPADVLDYCDRDRLDLLRGLWDSDGCYHPTLVYFRSSSPQLLQQVGLLLGSLKISYSVLDNYVYVLDGTRFKSLLGKSQLPAKLDEGIANNYLAVASHRFGELLTEAIATTDSKTRQAITTSLQNATLFKPKASQYKQKLDRWDELYRHLYTETYLQDARYVYVMAVEEAGVAECFDLQMEDQSSPYFLAEGVVTHNCYQEQIMKVAQDLGGYSLGQADLLRRCLSGSSEIVDAATGETVTLLEIANHPEYWLGRLVFCVNLTQQTITQRPIVEIHRNGIRRVWEISTGTHRKIKATPEHLFYSESGWQPLHRFKLGDRIGLTPTLSLRGNPQTTDPQLQLIGNSGTAFEREPQRAIGQSEIFWDEIVALHDAGEEEVFDLSIPDHHNFIANDFIAHNCMGKKKVSEMQKHRELFIDGSTKNGVSPKVADHLFDQMVLFAEYCLSYDTEILTVEYGPMAIGQIVEKQIPCTVYSVDGEGYLYRQPIAQWHHRGQQEVFEYALADGRVVRATQDHKFMIKAGQMLAIDEIFEQGLQLIGVSEKLVSRQPLGIQTVYDIGVERDHNFILANGLVASNCFNKSHSTAYGYVTYQTAYLKANYPVEYMAALLTSNSGDQDKVQKYIANCQELNITVQGPDINRSGVDFTPVDANPEKGTILFGLSAVKNIGDNAIHAILAEREANGRFQSLADLCDRINLHTVNSRALESLIKCGALDGLNSNRKQAIEYMPLAIKWAQDRAKEQETGQLNLFDQLAVMTETSTFESAPVPPNIADFPVEEKLQFEKELLGFYVSEHPLKNAGRIAEQLGIEVVSLGKLDEQKSRTKINVLVVLTEVKQILTKKDERRMAFLQMEDIEGKAEAVVFPDTYEQIHELLIPDTPLLIHGKVDRRDDRTQLIVEEAKVLKLDELTPLREAVVPTRITEMILLELTTDRINMPEMLDRLKGILEEHSADKTKATVPAVAIIVKAGDRHRAAAICGPNFWVQDCHNVVTALNFAGFPAVVYSLPPGNGMGNLPPFPDQVPFKQLTVPYLNSIRSILQNLDEG